MNREALVAVLGNQYSVPVAHVGAPVTARVHRERVCLWRDTDLIADHQRAADGAHRRVVDPEHYAALFGRKPRAQVMLYRERFCSASARGRNATSASSRAANGPISGKRSSPSMPSSKGTARPLCSGRWRAPRGLMLTAAST